MPASRYDIGSVIDASILADRIATDGDWDRRGQGYLWRASGLGACPRGQVLGAVGVEGGKDFDAKTLRTFALGNLLGDWVVDCFADRGILVGREVPFRSRSLNMAGHADAIIRWDDLMLGVEVKTANSSSMKYRVDEGPQPDHILQVGSYMAMAEESDIRPDRWVIVYVGKDYAGTLTFDADYTWGAMAVAQVAILNDALRRRVLPPCTCTTAYGGTGPFYCSYLDRDEDRKLVEAIGQGTSRSKKDMAPRVKCCARSPEGLAVAIATMNQKFAALDHDAALD